MIRVTTFSMDGIELKYASMSMIEAEDYVIAGRKLLDRGKEVTAEEWLSRRNATVLAALNKPVKNADDMWTENRLKAEFDLPTVDALYIAILKFSGLQPGEAAAATASGSSAAA